MHTFTIKNQVTPGLRLSPPDADIPSWHLRLGAGEEGREETLIPVDKSLSTYLSKVHGEVKAAMEGVHQSGTFEGCTPEQLRAAWREVFDGWTVDELFLAEDVLCPSGAHHPKGGPCLVHIAVPSDGRLELEAGSYDEVFEGGRVKRVYRDIDVAAGITPLHIGEGVRGTPEHLFKMERGSSFRIRRASGPWTEALVLWTGHELKLLPSRKERGKPRQASRERRYSSQARV